MYFNELKRTMEHLGSFPETVFIGQAVSEPGTAMSNTLKDVNPDKLIETPVFEEMQMGISIGLALNGYLPISIFPRWNFLLLAANQLVNHLDKISNFSENKYSPKVIIRTAIGSIRPLDPQSQHTGDFTEGFKKILSNVQIVKITEPDQIFPTYEKALNRKDNLSTIIVECADYYNEK
tara:strand:+ start:55 stop:588 length:534 start_codon:yes stop_codon:yes gene_type:complete